MKVFWICCIFSFLFLSKSSACFNGESYYLKNNSLLFADIKDNFIPRGHDFFLDNFEKELIELDSLYRKTDDLAYLSDYGLVLVLLKQYQHAEAVFMRIERQNPNSYATAANLGTMYELMGENQKAYTWLNKAISLDPSSHHGSEWIHLNILKLKLSEPDSISSMALIRTDFGLEPSPVTSLSKEEIIKLKDALLFQLNERLSFIKAPDLLVGHLLFDLANVSQLISAEGRAKAYSIYVMAERYGYNTPLLQLRKQNLRPIKTALPVETELAKPNLLVQNKNYLYAAVGVIILILLVITFSNYRNKKKELKKYHF
ncbi:MAG: hypothetical protein CFE21_06410 [Bacteroidetes bacterium B1(2017)]|nr:MAG: hypothetical protein CFE21_06410 [Bacteroidetes bacterium B1(2017)]